jgi:heme-degrading monooxygenase HmoA
MYASIRRYKMEPKNMDALVKRIGGAVEVISKLPGFKAYYVVRGTDGTMATVSVFSDRHAAEESNKTAATWVKANAADLFTGTPDVVVGEVVAHN